ncbi:zinc finger BED domain-containing protein 4-like [Gastrophryne carolinensis]
MAKYLMFSSIPALHKFVEQKVGQSLSLWVCTKVHGSALIWSCNYGQGQYMSFKAHWVNVVPAQQLGQVTPLWPPRSQAVLPVTVCDSASSSSTVRSILNAPSAYHVCRAQRCHAVLHMVCLGERSHTGEELLKLIHQEIKTWLTPRKLEMGTMVTDNRSNILSALRQGSLSHVPCMAHVFNLVVKHFLKSSPHLQDILTTGRKLCMHFSHSYTAKHTLLELQRQNGIPQHSLVCDVPTRWNFTLHMLDRLYEQRKAITDFLMIQADRGTPLCNFNVNQWQLIGDTCRLLRPFEEATLFVSRQDYVMNNVIPLLHVIQHMLETMAGQGTGDMSHTFHGHINPMGAEEEEEEQHSEEQFSFGEMGDLSSHLTGEEGQEQPVELEGCEEGETEDPDTLWQYAVEMETGSPSESLAQMARCMLTCLRSDHRIVSICQRDDFWLSTVLDPCFRHKMGAFFKPAEREDKLTYYKDILCSQLADAYLRHGPYSHRSDSGGPLRSPSTAIAAAPSAAASVFSR